MIFIPRTKDFLSSTWIRRETLSRSFTTDGSLDLTIGEHTATPNLEVWFFSDCHTRKIRNIKFSLITARNSRTWGIIIDGIGCSVMRGSWPNGGGCTVFIPHIFTAIRNSARENIWILITTIVIAFRIHYTLNRLDKVTIIRTIITTNILIRTIIARKRMKAGVRRN